MVMPRFMLHRTPLLVGYWGVLPSLVRAGTTDFMSDLQFGYWSHLSSGHTSHGLGDFYVTFVTMGGI